MNDPNLFNSSDNQDTEFPLSAWGENSSGYQTDNLKDGYQENPHEGNLFDTPYSETFADTDPNPKLSSGWEIE